MWDLAGYRQGITPGMPPNWPHCPPYVAVDDTMWPLNRHDPVSTRDTGRNTWLIRM
jgi:hypothetical protein